MFNIKSTKVWLGVKVEFLRFNPSVTHYFYNILISPIYFEIIGFINITKRVSALSSVEDTRGLPFLQPLKTKETTSAAHYYWYRASLCWELG